jgi:hypothetical protein
MAPMNETVHIELIIISLHYVFLNESIVIILLKTIDSLMCIWDCGFVHNLINECAEMEGVLGSFYQECQDLFTILCVPRLLGSFYQPR